MSTTFALPSVRPRRTLPVFLRPGQLAMFACVALALALLGYHPWCEDGGIYASALAQRLHPSLYPAERGFAIAHTDHSLFIPLLSFFGRVVSTSASDSVAEDALLFTFYVLSVVATIVAAQWLLRELFPDARARAGSLLLFSASLGLPIAGTSLYLADPYLTARSASTPLLLLAFTAVLQRRGRLALACLLVSAALHPLMTVWAAWLLLMFAARMSSRPALLTASLSAATVAAMALILFCAPAESPAVRLASLTRTYWFLQQWAWYEWVGVVAPIALLCLMSRDRQGLSRSARDLAWSMALGAAVITLASLLLIHTGGHSMLLARMQPMRSLHTVYLLFLLLLGGTLCGLRGPRSAAFPLLLLVAAAGGLLAMQRTLYRDLPHLQLPWQPASGTENGYEQAFLWIRHHAPSDALFALDADYTAMPGEDAQVFRAVARRSSLPDDAKDGGIASVVPRLAEAWRAGSAAQAGLSHLTDSQRAQRLRPLGASWLVLPAAAATALPCPYRNHDVQVCRLP